MGGTADKIRARLAKAMCEPARDRAMLPCEICLKAAELVYAELALMGLVGTEAREEDRARRLKQPEYGMLAEGIDHGRPQTD